jgi:poly(ADP-ribose) glycohydrolase ARH3
MAGAARDAVAGALLAALAGDCIGAPYEGGRPVGRDGAARRVERALSRRILRYTDDTELLLALTDHLVADDDRVDGERLARRMLERFDARRGYGAGMRRLVELWRAGWAPDEATTAVFPDGSFGNGAAMRVAPVGLRWAGRPDVVTDVAARSARITHAHPVGIDGAVVQAHAVAWAASTGAFTLADVAALPASTAELREGLDAAVHTDPATAPAAVADVLGTAPVAHRSVPAALWCAATSEDVPQAITLAVALGGDTDTVATMAAAIRGAVAGVAGVPAAWVTLLEGHAEVRDAADRLSGSIAGDPTNGTP